MANTVSIRTSLQILALSTLVGIAGCNSKTAALNKSDKKPATESSKVSDAEKPADEKAEIAKVINKPGSVANKGTYIKILVNKSPITNYDINRRVKFLQLRRTKGGAKTAENELIEQALKLQEAKRTKTLATDAEVERAFANFAKRNKSSKSRMAQQLNQFGVGATHFKEFLRTQISWQRTVSGRFQAETRNLSQGEAIVALRKSGEAKPQLAEYNLQQIVFVIPQAKRKALLKSRRAEANSFRQRFTSCEAAKATVKTLRDVVIREQRRILEPELPPVWRDEVSKLSIGQTTSAKDTEKGVEFLAVCGKRLVNDDRVAQIATQSKEFESFDTKGSKVSQDYLEELRKRATIVYR